MIVKIPPGMTADRSSEFSEQALISNLNAYAEAWTQVATSGTAVTLSASEVASKNIVLTAGASGAFSLTLPPTSRIIDALGPTVPNDGSYWFPLYIYNNGVGQTATLTAADASTTIDPVNATIADGHCNKWMVNVVGQTQNNAVLTLYFHNVFSVCCGAAVQETPPLLLQFGGLGNDQNTVVKYDISAPGTVFARTLDVAQLGTGGTTYTPATFDSSGPSALYNPWDDKMYFLALKTVPGPTTTSVLVQFDPRTLTISGEMTLPAGWSSGVNATLVDVADSWAWIQSSFDGTLRAFSTISFTEMFNDGGALAAPPYATSPADIAVAAGQIIITDSTTFEILHLITVTGAATFQDTQIPLPPGSVPFFANDGPSRRRWIEDRNKVLITQSDLFSPTNPLVIDLNNLAVETLYVDTNTFQGTNGPFWDPYLHRVVGVNFGASGLGIGDDTGAILGLAGDGASWTGTRPMTIGGLALFSSLNKLGGFNETTPTTTPEEEYETSDGFISPAGNTFVVDNACVALRRAADYDPTTPEQAATLSSSFASTGAAVAFFQHRGSLMGDDLLVWDTATSSLIAGVNISTPKLTGTAPGLQVTAGATSGGAGVTSITGNDIAGSFTMVGVTDATVNFSATLPATPVVVITCDSTGNHRKGVTAVSTSSFTVSFDNPFTGTVYYHCLIPV